MFVGTNDPRALALAALLALTGAACTAFGALMARSAKLGVEAKPACRAGQPLAMTLEARRGALLPSGRITLDLAFRNLMLDEERVVPIILRAGTTRTTRFVLPVDTRACGRVEVCARAVRAFDPLGLTSRAMPCALRATYTVYPQMVDLTVPLERAPRATFSGSSYDLHRRGQDISEPFDIRDYRESDAPHAIHWKLSAKVDKLVVREASHPSNYDILVLVDRARFTGPKGPRVSDELMSAILSMAVSASYDLCRQNLGHNVAVSTGERIVDAMVDSVASFDRMLDFLVCAPVPDAFGKDVSLFDRYRRERSFTKTVLITGDPDQDAFAEMALVTDLSVVLLVEDGAEAVEERADYVVTSVPVDALDARVRSVAI